MQPSEIVTAVQEGLRLTIVISENNGFQCIRRLQMNRAGRSFGNEFRRRDGSGRLDGDYLELDLVKVAEGLGAVATRAETPDEVRAALVQARRSAGVNVIVVPTERHRDLPSSGVWWDVAPAEVSEDSAVQELRREYDQSREALQHFYY